VPGGPDGKYCLPSAIHINLRAGGRGQTYLQSGWAGPELRHTWTVGNRSIIHLPLKHDFAVDYALSVTIISIASPPEIHRQRLKVEVNGHRVGAVVIRQPCQLEFLIEYQLLKGKGTAEIVFLLPDACAPCEWGHNSDNRQLALGIKEVAFIPIDLMPVAARFQSIDHNVKGFSDQDVFSSLQSLGINCELGFVQRLAGAEPLDLFRWAHVPLRILLDGLDHGFEGFGAPENIRIEEDDATEFQVVDTKYGFRNHSFAFARDGATKDDIFRRETTRLPWLVRNLIDDLKFADRLFVYHDAGQCSIVEMRALLSAIRQYGSSWLLWVALAPSSDRAGEVALLTVGLIRGYVRSFQAVGNVATFFENQQDWLAVGRRAFEIWQRHREPEEEDIE